MKQNKTQKIIMVLLLSLIILLSACGKQDNKPKEIKIHAGLQGLTAEFRAEAPPSQVYEEQPFQVLVDIQNRGAAEITDGVYTLGYEKAFLNVVDETQGYGQPTQLTDTLTRTFNLPGKSVFNPDGEFQLLKFFADAKKLPSLQETYTTTLMFTACYNYKTTATSTVCIDSDIYSQQTNKPCTPKTIPIVGGQGGPVAVMRVDSKMLIHKDRTKLKPQFTISIQNQGNGKLFAPGYAEEACSAKPLGQKWNRAKVRAYLSEIELECRPKLGNTDLSAMADLTEAVTTVTCELAQGQPLTLGTYTTLLTVELEYGYTFTETKRVEIKKQT